MLPQTVLQPFLAQPKLKLMILEAMFTKNKLLVLVKYS
jgi:hypothetical protein